MTKTQKIQQGLFFDHEAEEAVTYYLSIFPNSRLISITRPSYGMCMITFEILGQEFVAINGGSFFRPREPGSMVVNCKTQKEIDLFWERLSELGEKQECGWVKDRFGVSWQIVPSILSDLLTDSDPVRNERVIQAVYQMDKLDIATLKKAAAFL